jgi:hypothetical protein
MTDILLWAKDNSADILATLGGAGTAGALLRWVFPRAVEAGIAWRKAKREAADAAKKAAEAKAAEEAKKAADAKAADEMWRAQMINGLQANSAAVDALKRQMEVFTSTLKEHDERTRETSKVVARVDGFLDRLERAESHAFEAKVAAASAERAVARLQGTDAFGNPTTNPGRGG